MFTDKTEERKKFLDDLVRESVTFIRKHPSHIRPDRNYYHGLAAVWSNMNTDKSADSSLTNYLKKKGLLSNGEEARFYEEKNHGVSYSLNSRFGYEEAYVVTYRGVHHNLEICDKINEKHGIDPSYNCIVIYGDTEGNGPVRYSGTYLGKYVLFNATNPTEGNKYEHWELVQDRVVGFNTHRK